LKMLLEIIFLYLLLFAKVFKNTFPKDLKKQANVVQNIKIEESNHTHEIISIGLILSNVCTSVILPTSYNFCFVFALVCVGINRQKGGD
jgi:hypothetical protein